jgi:hypothetical protein
MATLPTLQSALDAHGGDTVSTRGGKLTVRECVSLDRALHSLNRERPAVDLLRSMRQQLRQLAGTTGAALTTMANRSVDTQEPGPRLDLFNAVLVLSALKFTASAAQEKIGESLGLAAGISSSKKDTAGLRDELDLCITGVLEAPVSYVIGSSPVLPGDPFVRAMSKWIHTCLQFAGIPTYALNVSPDSLTAAVTGAFQKSLYSSSRAGALMRNYLAIDKHSQPKRSTQEVLLSLEASLSNWLNKAESGPSSRDAAWRRYRNALKELPDAKETMFNEQFGVRAVFQPPIISYHVNSKNSESSAQTVEDIGGLFGGLISDRVPGEDLIILSGGPGSGKSTICRVLASMLAEVEDIHPIFLRLRRVKEGADITTFLEESLHRLGLIDRLSDLREVTNLVLILDGFDELAMSSKARLRQFFGMLRDELSYGPLKDAKVVVSGRDTLFPRGQGMPPGSHILSIQPFDKSRVEAWGKMWRLRHPVGPGSSFSPETLLQSAASRNPMSSLEHLVRWPLTLHLLAQIQTAGRLQLADDGSAVEKAYLYRAILAETAARQVQQTNVGSGRLEPNKMRLFLRRLAWEMYLRSVDAMDPVDVTPILAEYYPELNEVDLTELADVAVVNAPELTKGEETGFEFVHKSFSEFLVAEELAYVLERVSFKAPEFGLEQETWRMSEAEGASVLAGALAIRVVPQEVQEMLEPMLGGLTAFLNGDRVDDVVDSSTRREGLSRLIDRLEGLYIHSTNGGPLTAVASVGIRSPLVASALEAYANYCVGIVLLGSAAARRLRGLQGDGEADRYFQCEPFAGAIWRFLAIVQAGGVVLDGILGQRLFEGATIIRSTEIDSGNAAIKDESDLAFKPSVLEPLQGFLLRGPKLAGALSTERAMRDILSLLEQQWGQRNYRRSVWRRHLEIEEEFFRYLNSLGVLPDSGMHDVRRTYRMLEEIVERVVRVGDTGGTGSYEMLRHLQFEMERLTYRRPVGEYSTALYHMLREIESYMGYRMRSGGDPVLRRADGPT